MKPKDFYFIEPIPVSGSNGMYAKNRMRVQATIPDPRDPLYRKAHGKSLFEGTRAECAAWIDEQEDVKL